MAVTTYPRITGVSTTLTSATVGPNLADAGYLTIQAALDAGYSDIYVQPGTYTLTTAIILPDRAIKITGSGRGVTTLTIGAAAIAAFYDNFDQYRTVSDLDVTGTINTAGQKGVEFGANATGSKWWNMRYVGITNIRTDVLADAASYPVIDVYEVYFTHTGADASSFYWNGPGFLNGYYFFGVAFAAAGGFTGSPDIHLVASNFSCANGGVLTSAILDGCRITDAPAGGVIISGTSTNGHTCNLRETEFGAANAGAPTRWLDLTGAATKSQIVNGRFRTAASSESIRTVQTLMIVKDNTDCKVLESGAADNNAYENILSTSTIIGVGSTVNGAKRFGGTGAVTDSYVTLLTHTNQKGLIGQGTIKNTDGADSMTVEEQGIDAFGTTDVLESVVAFGAERTLNTLNSFGAARPPYLSYRVRVKNTVPASAAAYSIQFTSQGGVS